MNPYTLMQEVVAPPPGRRNARDQAGGAYDEEQRARTKAREIMEQKIAEIKPAKRYVPIHLSCPPSQLT